MVRVRLVIPTDAPDGSRGRDGEGRVRPGCGRTVIDDTKGVRPPPRAVGARLSGDPDSAPVGIAHVRVVTRRSLPRGQYLGSGERGRTLQCVLPDPGRWISGRVHPHAGAGAIASGVREHTRNRHVSGVLGRRDRRRARHRDRRQPQRSPVDVQESCELYLGAVQTVLGRTGGDHQPVGRACCVAITAVDGNPRIALCHRKPTRRNPRARGKRAVCGRHARRTAICAAESHGLSGNRDHNARRWSGWSHGHGDDRHRRGRADGDRPCSAASLAAGVDDTHLDRERPGTRVHVCCPHGSGVREDCARHRGRAISPIDCGGPRRAIRVGEGGRSLRFACWAILNGVAAARTGAAPATGMPVTSVRVWSSSQEAWLFVLKMGRADRRR